jgi:nucleotide-binding universal stress UspA family protein
MAGEHPSLLVAYDGSDVSKAAIRHASALFPGSPALVVTVWEPGLAAIAVGPDPLGTGFTSPDLETVEQVDRSEREHASQVAQEGASLARSLGLAAEPHSVPDELDVARTLLDIGRERAVDVVVIGSHGISGLRSRLLGGVSRKLIEHCEQPLLVVRGERD